MFRAAQCTRSPTVSEAITRTAVPLDPDLVALVVKDDRLRKDHINVLAIPGQGHVALFDAAMFWVAVAEDKTVTALAL